MAASEAVMREERERDREKNKTISPVITENTFDAFMEYQNASNKRTRDHDDDNSLKQVGVKKKIVGENMERQNNDNNMPSACGTGTSYMQQNNNPTFSKKNQGPYGIWVKKIKADDTDLSPYKIGSILYKNYSDFTIKKRNKNKSEIIFKSGNEANKLLMDKTLATHNLECYLPNYRIQRKAIAKGIDAEFTEEELLDGCKSDIKISDIKRLNMRNKNSTNENDKWIPSRTILITFEGQILPNHIYIFNYKTNIEPYVSKPTQCYNCFKFGHISKTCRSKKRCIMCGTLEHNEACEMTTPSCANCQGPHKSIERECPIYIEQMKLKIIMAFDNVSYEEAKKSIQGNITSAPLKTKEDFPRIKQNRINALQRTDYSPAWQVKQKSKQKEDNIRKNSTPPNGLSEGSSDTSQQNQVEKQQVSHTQTQEQSQSQQKLQIAKQKEKQQQQQQQQQKQQQQELQQQLQQQQQKLQMQQQQQTQNKKTKNKNKTKNNNSSNNEISTSNKFEDLN